MTGDEFEQGMRMLIAHWRAPELTDDEADALARILAPYGLDDLEAAIDLLAEQPRQWRPYPPDVGNALRTVRRRSDEVAAAAAAALVPPEPPGEPARDPHRWLDAAREELARAVARRNTKELTGANA